MTTLTRGYYSALAPEVREAAKKEEQRAMELVGDVSTLPAELFAQTLRDNAEKTLSAWKDLHGELLTKHDLDHRIDYDKSRKLKSDKVLKY